MYDKNKLIEFGNCREGATVQEVIDALSKLPPTMQVSFCGHLFGFLHVDTTKNLCSFDAEIDDAWYDNEEDKKDE